MPSKAAQSQKKTDENEGQNDEEQPKSRQQRARGQSDQQANGQQSSNGPAPEQPQQPTYYYDPQAAARTGLLHLATAWKEAGGTYQAIHAYMEILLRYPQTGAAAAATEGLVDLATKLEKQGRFYTALGIYQKLERSL